MNDERTDNAIENHFQVHLEFSQKNTPPIHKTRAKPWTSMGLCVIDPTRKRAPKQARASEREFAPSPLAWQMSSRLTFDERAW